jgi:SMODS and SLOG-associating 2TM effector domain 3/SMODS and SLOG-associating 2TM effector domain 1
MRRMVPSGRSREGVGGLACRRQTPHSPEAAPPSATTAKGTTTDRPASLTLLDDDLPVLFRSADATAIAAQRQYLLATRLRLCLLVVAAAAGAVTIAVGRVEWSGLVGAAAFVAAAITELSIVRDRPDRRWYEGRAAAESAKTLGWRYAVGAAPFGVDALSERDADQLLVQRLADVLTDLDDLSVEQLHGTAEQITPTMRAVRAASLQVRQDVYERDRIGQELDWYQTKSAWNQRRARQLTLAMLLFEIVGAIGGLLRAVGIGFNLLGVAAAAAAALGSWLQTKQHQVLGHAYAVTAQELSSIRSLIQWQESESDWSRFVDDAETAISREHTLWRANRGLPARRSARGPS